MAALEANLVSLVPLADERTVQLLVTSLCLVVALLVAAAIIALVNRWRRRRDAADELSPNAQLAQFRSLYEAGTISQEEFERLRALLGARVREALDLRTSPPANPAKPGTGPDQQPPPDKPDAGSRPA